MPDADERRQRCGTRVRNRGRDEPDGKAPVPVQFSIGITSWRPGMDWQAMYQLADKNLYIDKRRRHAGRKAVGQAPG
jgi:PleD family two-component response regulator